MKKNLLVAAIGAAGLVSAKGLVVDNSKVSSAEKFNTAKNVSVDLQENVGITCTFLVSITDPRTGETKQWRETYSVNTKEECENKHSERKAQLEAAAEANDSID
ncbi:hypothetical protein BAX97_15830 [Elizabethkingia meningoseptica]|uniref:hypothetical protein n=1 Tax=Elizabethkingia meningoseptica TaxID=238 RepID=UPI000332C906|nr:hypothetical protein [Elizabethkingia meningoseptica]AQX05183.1 hypothetical protein BBD33_07960 [Elizabethkingia meningoseptica]AQX47228.1 hypothetical protein B5G46_07950 [Elizabethkingia meningoseptica]EOR29655.1 hypothetical protein L100_09984 [Elizabethkingia meningoseptica ATCC 13253 = NBRC 12535]KUY18126.1 hypothetical protein ATB99_17275 [Elizabethkingia meningoseptica]MDE5489292.1 hypothetical protein [Elizabethkingia meningoseptica]